MITLPLAPANTVPTFSLTGPGAEASSDPTFCAPLRPDLNCISPNRALNLRTGEPGPPPLKLTAAGIVFFSDPTQAFFSHGTFQTALRLAARADGYCPPSHFFIPFVGRWVIILVPTGPVFTLLVTFATVRSPLSDLPVAILSLP